MILCVVTLVVGCTSGIEEATVTEVAEISEETKALDCNTFAEAYTKIQDVQTDPLDAIELLQPEEDSIAWLARETEARSQESQSILEVIQNISLTDSQMLLARDMLATSIKDAVNGNTDLMELSLTTQNVIDSDDHQFLRKHVKAIQSQRIKIADIKRERTDLVRGVNNYCGSNLTLPFGHQ